MYHGQFQKHEPAPLVEQDIDPHVISDEGPVMAPHVVRAALQRSVAKLCFHAGFEECQPSTLDAFTEIAGDFLSKLAASFVGYHEAPKTAIQVPSSSDPTKTEVVWRPRFSMEETVLHSLQDSGCDLESIEAYVSEDIDRTSSRVASMHERMKAHLADLLRPALTDAGPDGSNAFNDGSEQFVGGDFAEELGEDFFGFKELGLDAEFGMASLSVPLHLLQNRMHSQNQAQNPRYVTPSMSCSYWYSPDYSALATNAPSFLPTPAPLPPITIENVKLQIGIAQNFFLAKLHANGDAPLVEDDELPQKQRFPKPRLPPTGKISSPRKRPIKEPGPGKGHPRKKMKLDELAKDGKEIKELGKEIPKDAGKEKAGAKVAKELAKTGIAMERTTSSNPIVDGGGAAKNNSSPQKDKGKASETGGMISPESLEAP